MTTNQTIGGVPRDEIVGVPRKLLNAIGAFLNYTDPHGLHDQVWQLLTQPPGKHQGEPVAWLAQCKSSGLIEQAEPNEKASNPDHWTDAFPVYRSAPAIKLYVNISNVKVTVNPDGSYSIDPGEQPAPVTVTDEQILQAMRPSIYAADGGYVFDTAPQDVIGAGRAVLAIVTPAAASPTSCGSCPAGCVKDAARQALKAENQRIVPVPIEPTAYDGFDNGVD